MNLLAYFRTLWPGHLRCEHSQVTRWTRIAAALLTGAAVQLAAAQQASPPAAGPSEPAGVRNTMAQRMQACVVCHGREGRATNQGYFPRIAGKP
jgi:cytochrome c553